MIHTVDGAKRPWIQIWEGGAYYEHRKRSTLALSSGKLARVEAALDRRAERFTFRHPYLTMVIMFIAVPLLMLAAVSALTLLAALPAAMLFGLL